MGESAEREGKAFALPKLWAGSRRRQVSLLVLSGFAQAAAAGTGALLLSSVLSSSRAMSRPGILALLVGAALVIGLLRMVERIVAEQLSQDYVHQIRIGLLRRNLVDGKVKSLGVAVSRTTNDLTSVKNWVSQGVAPLAVGVPLILGAGVALMWIEPLLALALGVPILVLLAAMAVIAPIVYRRSRRLRRRRGRLSSQVADTVLATTAIRSAGGSDRELRRIAGLSHHLVTAAVNRSKAAGALRAAAAATSGVAAALVVGIGLAAGLPTHSIAGALAIVGFLATPIHDLGRVAEYRQSYRAARRIIAPAIEPPSSPRRRASTTGYVDSPGSDTSVKLAGILLGDGRALPQFLATPGDRIVVDTGDRTVNSELLARMAGLNPSRGSVLVNGRDLSEVGPNELRALVGYAAQGMMLVRGTILRTVRYRCPDASIGEGEEALTTVGLRARVAALPEGVRTRLVHGGEPLAIAERARLLLARAAFREPPLMVLDNLDADLGGDGRDMMRTLLKDFPGVVIVASDDPGVIIDPTAAWRPEPVHDHGTSR